MDRTWKLRYLLILPIGSLFLTVWISYGLPHDGNQARIQNDVTVSLKLVQVYVVGKDGNPVTDLGVQDFELFDSGKAKTLTEFEVHGLSLGNANAIPIEEQSLKKRTARKIFLFFDFAFNTQTGIQESKKTALKFLETEVSPEDEIGIISYNARKGLTINEYLSIDHGRIRQVIKNIGPNVYLGRAADLGDENLREIDETINTLAGKASSDATLSSSEGTFYEADAKQYIGQLASFSAALRYIPGIKTIVLFTSGISNSLLYGSDNVEDTFGTFPGRPGVRSSYQSMCKAFSASNTIVYPINVKGISVNARKKEDRELLGDSALHELATRTGGRYFDNVREYEKIGPVIQKLTASYYVLGYYINEELDGKFHDIKVRVKRKGCEVHGQSGYFNPKPFTEYTENEKTLQLIDLALSENPHLQEAADFDISVLPRRPGEKTDLVVIAELPYTKLSEVAGEKIEFITIVFNDKSDIVVLRRKELNQWPKRFEEAYAKSIISLPPGQFECRAVLRNMTTGKGARGSSRISVSHRPLMNQFSFLQPLLLMQRHTPIYLGEETHQEPRLWEIYPFEPKEYAPIINDSIKAGDCLMAIMPFIGNPNNEATVSFSVSAINLSSGENIIIPIRSLDWISSGMDRAAKLNIDLAILKPGSYAFYISAKDLSSYRQMISAGAIKIE
jgi:VWFA-related protein